VILVFDCVRHRHSETGGPNDAAEGLIDPGLAALTLPLGVGAVYAAPNGTFQNGGTDGQRYNAVGATSQYDVACAQMFQKP
jgi:hypothetical protein